MAVIVLLTGLTIISHANFDESESLESDNVVSKHEKTVFGVTAVFLGQFFHAIDRILIEYIVKHEGGQDPLYVQGWEGVWCFLMNLILLVAIQYSSCFSRDNNCID